MKQPKSEGWYKATYGEYTGEYLFTRGKWYAPGRICGEEVLQLVDVPDKWGRL